MNISQALRSIKDVKGRLAKLRAQMGEKIQYRVDEEPAYLLKELEPQYLELSDYLVRLQEQVAIANVAHSFSWKGRNITLAGAVRLLAEMKSQIAWLESLPTMPKSEWTEEETVHDYRDDKLVSVVKRREYKCQLTTRERDARVDILQRSFNALNTDVEALNSRVEVELDG